MPDFPTLSTDPNARGWSEGPKGDPTIRSEFENGDIQTRPRTTKVPKVWSFTYSDLPDVDKVLIEIFERDTVVYGGAAFTWTNPIDSVAYTVRFSDKVNYDLEDTQEHAWKVDIKLEEVL